MDDVFYVANYKPIFGNAVECEHTERRAKLRHDNFESWRCAQHFENLFFVKLASVWEESEDPDAEAIIARIESLRGGSAGIAIGFDIHRMKLDVAKSLSTDPEDDEPESIFQAIVWVLSNTINSIISRINHRDVVYRLDEVSLDGLDISSRIRSHHFERNPKLGIFEACEPNLKYVPCSYNINFTLLDRFNGNKPKTDEEWETELPLGNANVALSLFWIRDSESKAVFKSTELLLAGD